MLQEDSFSMDDFIKSIKQDEVPPLIDIGVPVGNEKLDPSVGERSTSSK